MSQRRLNIFARKVSDEELSLEQKIRKLESEIKQQKKDIADLESDLQKVQKRQQEEGLRTAEITVTDEYIRERLKPLQGYLNLLETKYERLRNKSNKAQQLASRQSDLFSR